MRKTLVKPKPSKKMLNSWCVCGIYTGDKPEYFVKQYKDIRNQANIIIKGFYVSKKSALDALKEQRA